MENIDFTQILAHGGTQDVLIIFALWLVKSISGVIKDWIKSDIENKVESSLERKQIIDILNKIYEKIDDNNSYKREQIYPIQENSRTKQNAKI